MSRAREVLHGHFAGCANRKVKSWRHVDAGTLVTLECGHAHFTGSFLHNPTVRPCLEGPCYHPFKAMSA